ncbi:hypothetical protein [Bartonella sp. ML70XJBT.G]|uniref:hypothetical protein n=1 Tax=Bartonella sp. ML70XJBT.G TaxID=3019093 RepID=UPI0023606771|nr:hypothetical protein [Bartonella sp. ML70XJBT.G]
MLSNTKAVATLAAGKYNDDAGLLLIVLLVEPMAFGKTTSKFYLWLLKYEWSAKSVVLSPIWKVATVSLAKKYPCWQ